MIIVTPRRWLAIAMPLILGLFLFHDYCCFPSVHAIGFFEAGGDLTENDPIAHDFAAQEETAGVDRIPPASPECWLTAIKAFSYLSGEQSGTYSSSANSKSAKSISMEVATTACSWMTPEHQKLLALHLSSCHLNDVGRPLFMKEVNDPTKAAICSSNSSLEIPEVTLDNLAICLTILSDAGVTTYTHFFSYVNQLCTRLLQEVMIGHYYETSHRLAKSSQLAHERVDEVVQQHEMLWENWNERQSQLTQFQESFQKELLGQQEQWFQYQSSLQQNHTKELESQHRHIQKLSEAIAKANQSMKPWLAVIESLLTITSQNILSVLSCLQFAFGTICAIYIVTFLSLGQGLRKYLYTIVLLEVVAELALCFLSTQEVDHFGFLSIVKQDEGILTLRWGSNVLLVASYIILLLTSLIRRLTGRHEHELDTLADRSSDSIMRRMDIFEREMIAIQRNQRIFHQQSSMTPTETYPNYVRHGGNPMDYRSILPRNSEENTSRPPTAIAPRNEQGNPLFPDFYDAVSHIPLQPRGTNSLQDWREPNMPSTSIAVTPLESTLPTPTRNNWTSPQQEMRPSALPINFAARNNDTGSQTGNGLVPEDGHRREADSIRLGHMSRQPQVSQQDRANDQLMTGKQSENDRNDQVGEGSSSLKRHSDDGHDDIENLPKRPRTSATEDPSGTAEGN